MARGLARQGKGHYPAPQPNRPTPATSRAFAGIRLLHGGGDPELPPKHRNRQRKKTRDDHLRQLAVSPFVRKTLVFATEKGLDFELRPQGTPEFKEASPFGKMPALRDDDFTISDSTAIITYLDTLHPDPNLIPTEAKSRARTIWYEEFGDTIIAACGGKIFFNRVVSPKFYGRPGDLAAADEAQKT